VSNNNEKISNNIFTKRTLIVVLSTILAVVLLTSGVFAYYFIQHSGDTGVKSKDFYFESDLLRVDNPTYQLNCQATTFTFSLKNHADTLRYSEDNVNYTVSITNSDGVSLSKEQGTLDKDSAQSDTITVSGLKSGEEYVLTVTGFSGDGNASKGYKKVLSATIRVAEITSAIFKYFDNSDSSFVLLTVWTENLEGIVTVEYPDGVIPDNTCVGMESVQTNGKKFTYQYESGDSYTYRFFYFGTKPTVEDFMVKIVQDGTNQEFEAITKTII